MKWLIVIIILGIAVVLLVLNPKAARLGKSIWLIMQTSPYSQSGTGAGTIVIVGDSTAYGTGVSEPKDSIAGLIGHTFPAYRVETLAKNGRVISETIPVIQSLKSSERPDLLLLQIGGNDIIGDHSAEAIENDIRLLLTEAKKSAKQVLFMSSGNVGTAAYYVKNGQPNAEMERRTLIAREIFMKVATEQGITYIDLYTQNEDDLFLQEPETYLAIDGLHPSSAGYLLWYQQLVPKVKEVLIN